MQNKKFISEKDTHLFVFKEFFNGNRKYLFTLKILLLLSIPLLILYLPNNYIFNNIKYYFNEFYFSTIIKILISFISINLIFSIIRNLLIANYKLSHNFKTDYKDKAIVFIEEISLVLFIITFILYLIFILGIDLTFFFTALSVFAVAISIGFKEYIGNFFAGLVAMFKNMYEINDYISVGDIRGKVINTDFLFIKLYSFTGEYIYISNDIIFKKEFKNITKRKYKFITQNLSVLNSNIEYLDRFKEKLEDEIKKKFKEILFEDKIKIRIIKTSHNDSLIEVKVIIKKFTFSIECKIKKLISLEYIKFIKNQKITESKQ